MYEIRFYKGNYYERQQQANADRCVAYVEHHFNSTSSEKSVLFREIMFYGSKQ